MILLDANILLYACDDHSPHHSAARVWLERTIVGPELAALSWTVILAFLRLSTDPRVFQRPFSIPEAIETIAGWLKNPRFVLLQPQERHWTVLQQVLISGQASGKLVMDAHLGALAIEHGATLASADRDFARFPKLKLLNPLS
jgi:uncharacterized protein